tara:strand:+ start:1189 stop:1464 length:276 start_codon:yes stop_codon:yes gene_type:complete
MQFITEKKLSKEDILTTYRQVFKHVMKEQFWVHILSNVYILITMFYHNSIVDDIEYHLEKQFYDYDIINKYKHAIGQPDLAEDKIYYSIKV